MLATQPFPRDSVRKGFRAVRPGLTKMAHKQRHIGPKEHAGEVGQETLGGEKAVKGVVPQPRVEPRPSTVKTDRKSVV